MKIEVFYVQRHELEGVDGKLHWKQGWYWWPLLESDKPVGPFVTEQDAIDDAAVPS